MADRGQDLAPTWTDVWDGGLASSLSLSASLMSDLKVINDKPALLFTR